MGKGFAATMAQYAIVLRGYSQDDFILKVNFDGSFCKQESEDYIPTIDGGRCPVIYLWLNTDNQTQ
jgi:hypothetical protein